MKGIKRLLNNSSKKQKNTCLIVIILLVLVISIGVPTLARYKNRVITPDVVVWDGSVATSYRSGSGIESDPYIISNGAELAYFSSQLESNDYENTYFSLNGNIILNNGSFLYDSAPAIKYVLDSNTYYLEEYSNKYYSDIDRTGTEVSTINIFTSLDGFKGHFDGNSYSVYGLYITDSNKENLGLFTNLEGSVKNLYVDNSLIYGGIISAGIAANSLNSVIENVMFDGLVINKDNNSGISGGIIGISDNTSLTNTINKGTIMGAFSSGGLIGKSNASITINQSYNTGNINSTNSAGGLIGLIENNTSNINITKSYNTGNVISTISGGLIGKLNNNTNVNITNVFNTSVTNYNIGEKISSTINLTSGYFVSEDTLISNKNISDGFSNTTLTNLKDKDYVLTNLSLNEFVNETDVKTYSNNVWIYDINDYPILYIDDSNNPIANIHVSTYKWNNYSDVLNTISINNSITFTIEPTNLLNQYTIYYYVSSNKELKTKEQLEVLWNSYSDVVTINTEGEYIVYSKVVETNNANNVTYLNTDILRLDKTNPIAEISLDNNTWNNYENNPSNIYIDREKQIVISASDTLSNVNIEYYMSSEIKTREQLDGVSWTKYENPITLDAIGKYIVYTKVTNENNLVTLANTDIIVFNGYTNNSLSLGRNKIPLQNNSYVTSNSTIVLNFTYQNTESNLSNITHNLVSNIILPEDSIITIIDKTNNSVYEYKIPQNNTSYIYPFTLFNEIGKLNQKYVESDYYNNGVINENFDIILDLSKTNINTNYDNVNLNLEVHNSSDENIRPTLESGIKKFNIYSNINGNSTNGELYLDTTFNNTITFNRDFTTNVDINSGINYKSINGNIINDSINENKSVGLLFRMVNSNNENVNNDFYKNLKVKIGDTIYYPNNNVINIDLESGVENVNKTLSIITTDNNSNFETGTYYFKINNYISYNGYCSNQLGSDEISIPVTVDYNKINVNYNFDVKLDEVSRIINKSNINSALTFKILQSGYFYNPNIKVSLYKKDNLDPTNQDYSIVDLQNYVTNNLNAYSNNIYYVSTNPIVYNGSNETLNNFELNLITNNFDNTGYKFVFGLYSGNKKVGTIEKKFIVK